MTLHVAPGVEIPDSDLSVAFTRSAGPGGQNVNKVASRAVIQLDVARIAGYSADALARLRTIAGRRLTAAGILRVESQRTRDFHRNLEDALEKLRALIERSLEVPRPRRPTRVPRAAQAKRLASKRRTADKKRARSTHDD